MALDAYEREQFQREYASYLQSITQKCKEIIIQEIYEDLYCKYEPTTYERTFQLLQLENLNVEIQADGKIHLLFDGLNYTSAVDNSNQSDNVPFFVNYGHTDGTDGMYHNYPARKFMERAAKKIKQQFGVKVTVIKDRQIMYVEE